MNTLAIKVQRETDGTYRVYTSRNDNGWWAVGVPFDRVGPAMQVANAIREAAKSDGYQVQTTVHGVPV